MPAKQEINIAKNYTLDETAKIFSVFPSDLIEMAKRGAIDLCITLNEKVLMRRVPCKLSELIILVNKDDKLNLSQKMIGLAGASLDRKKQPQESQKTNFITLADKNDPMLPYNYGMISPGELVYLSRESCIELGDKETFEVKAFPWPERMQTFAKEFKEVNNKSLYQIFIDRAIFSDLKEPDLISSRYAYNPFDDFDEKNPDFPKKLLDENLSDQNFKIFQSLSSVFPYSFREALSIAAEICDLDKKYEAVFNLSEFNFSMFDANGFGSRDFKNIILDLYEIISFLLVDKINEYTFDRIFELACNFDLWISSNQSDKIIVNRSNVMVKEKDFFLIHNLLKAQGKAVDENRVDRIFKQKLIGSSPYCIINEYIYREFAILLMKEGSIDSAIKKLNIKISRGIDSNKTLKTALEKTSYNKECLSEVARKLIPAKPRNL